jgi:hypothetical protein
LTHSPTGSSTPRIDLWTLGLVAVLGGGYLLPAAGGPLLVVRSFAVWLLLMVAPGVWLFRILHRQLRGAWEVLLAGLVVSPVLLTVVAVAAMFAGASPHGAGRVVAGVSVALALGAAFVPRPTLRLPQRREAFAMLGFIAVLLALCCTLPFTREWWRIRSDAWFHAAVVAQIHDFGLPPEDPYFVGLPLQYMWFYHVMLATLADALRVGSFWVMAIVNAHALVALILAANQLAAVLRPRFAHRFAAVTTLLLTFNAGFWIFLPLKLVKAFMGDVRGMEEIRRTFALTPLHYDTANGFMNIYFNQEFFLDKFMVATAFGLALVFMTTAWAGAIDYLRTQRRFGLALVVASLIGMLGFHSLVGFVFLVGVVGGAVLLHLARGRVDDYRPRAAVTLVAVCIACLLVMTPYLYEVMSAKEHEQVFPLDFSFRKIASILISSAFVIAVSLRAKSFWNDRGVGARFLAFATAVVTAFCFSISLPGPNTYDKLGYFVFIPLAIVAGFAIADSVLARTGRARLRVLAAWVLLFFVPVNAIAFVSCFGTPDAVVVTPGEERLSAWVRDHTTRDAVFIDDHDRVPLLVTGPRRYFWGTEAYAEQWGYPRAEMSRRRHVVQALYGEAELDDAALDALASIDEEVFVVVRPEHAGRAVTRHPELFPLVHEDADLALAKVDKAACRAARR